MLSNQCRDDYTVNKVLQAGRVAIHPFLRVRRRSRILLTCNLYPGLSASQTFSLGRLRWNDRFDGDKIKGKWRFKRKGTITSWVQGRTTGVCPPHTPSGSAKPQVLSKWGM